MFEPGDILEVVLPSKVNGWQPPIIVGQKFVCNSVFKAPCCGAVGIDIGLMNIKASASTYCSGCGKTIPNDTTKDKAYYTPGYFRKIEPMYKLVEVDKEIIKQTRKLYFTMIVTRQKNCFCHTCKKDFHYLGINRHRAMHRDRKEDCKITYTNGDTRTFIFSQTRFPYTSTQV